MLGIEDTTINSIGILVLGSAFTFVATVFWRKRDETKRVAETLALDSKRTADGLASEQKRVADGIAVGHQLMVARITELEMKLAVVQSTVVPIATAFQAILIKELTHYHTPEMDALMVKIGPPNVLSDKEDSRLERLLVERTTDMGPLISAGERGAATILPEVMRRAKAEQLMTDEEVRARDIQVVTMPVDPRPKEDKSEP